MRGFLQGKLSEIQTCNIIMLFCVLVCLSVAFKYLNSVTLLQMWCEHYDDLEGGTTTTKALIADTW